MLVELDAEALGAGIDLVPVHTRRERGLLQLLLHRLRLEAVEPGRPDEPASVDEARQLVAREQRPLQQRVAWQREVLRVRQHRLDHLLWIPLLAEDRGAVLRMLVERRMQLVVEVVEQGDDAPALLVLAEMPRVPARRRLDGEGVPEERLALRVPRQRLPGLLACRLHRRG